MRRYVAGQLVIRVAARELRPVGGRDGGKPAVVADADIVRFVREQLGMALDGKQMELLQAEGQHVLLCCSRQWGKSTVTAAKAVHVAMTEAGSRIVVASPSERQSDLFLEKAREMVKRLGMTPRGDGLHGRSLLFPNGSSLVALPGNERTVRGFSNVSLLIFDEAARVPDELYQALLPLVSVSNGAVWELSTPFGRQGFFHRHWTSREGDWLRMSVTGPECPRISREQLEFQRRQLGERQYAQEYLCQFLETEDALVGVGYVDRAVRPEVPAFVPYGRAAQPPAAEERLAWKRITVGVDLGRDQTPTAIALVERKSVFTGQVSAYDYRHFERESMTVRYLERLPLGTPYVEVVQRVRDLMRDPNVVLWEPRLVVDATGVGSAVLEMFERADLLCPLIPVVLTSGMEASRAGKKVHVPRRDLLSRLAVVLEEERLGVAGNLPLWADLQKELWGLRTRLGERGRVVVTEGESDDLAFAVALAVWEASAERADLFGKRRLV